MTLKEKLHKVYEAIDAVEKRGHNKSQNYDYIKAADVTKAIRRNLLELRVYAEINFDFVGPTYTIAREKAPNAPFTAERVKCVVLFHDLDSPEVITGSGLGTGADTNDKAAYKAQTGALKYALKNAFLVPDEADPEADESVDGGTNYTPEEPPDFQEARQTAPRQSQAPKAQKPSSQPQTAQEPPQQRVLETTDVPLGKAQPENAPVPAGSSQPAPVMPQETAPAAADDALPTEEQLTQYRQAFQTLGDDLTAKGKLKSSKALPVNRKLLAFLLFITGAAEAKSITKAQWDDFFQRVDHVRGLEDGLVGLAKLVNKANGVEEKK